MIRIEPTLSGQLRLVDGSYGKDVKGVWWIRPPGGRMGQLSSTLYQITEHEDKTISVFPSILEAIIGPDGFATEGKVHGFVEHGIWRDS